MKSLQLKDKVFRWLLLLCAFFVILTVAGMCVTLPLYSLPVLKHMGWKFVFSTTWDPVKNRFGIIPFLAGTLITSFMALLISLPFSISVALLTGEYLRKGKIAMFFKYMTDLTAGIPSVIYGFWALFVLVPFVQRLEMGFNIIPYGVGLFTASIVLSVMIIPYTASIAREVISLVPDDLKEAGYSLGATRWEVIRHIVLPYARSGIFAGILLALGRAIGETMAVTMVIGNRDQLPKSIFEPANTMASAIANQFTEATSDIYLSALIGLGFMLFLVTVLINIAGRYMIKRLEIKR